VPQVIGDGPFKVINRRNQLWFQPAALLHLGSRQPFAPLTASRLGQVLERARFRFEPLEGLKTAARRAGVKPPCTVAG
jgi:hypothetical protein